MHCLLCSALLLLASAQLAVAEVDAPAELFDEAEHAARMLELIDSLIQSPDPTQQAAGLLMAEHARWAGWYPDQPILIQTEFLDRLHRLIDQANTPLARALLAQLCATRDIRSDCVQRGLDAAIVSDDGAELLARLQLTDGDDTDRLRGIMVEAQALNERHMDYALLLLDAMKAHGGFVDAELAVTPLIYGLTLSPAFSPFSKLCGAPATEDSELDEACERILERMMQGGTSMLLNAIGSAVSAQRRTAKGDPHAQERHEQWRAEIAAHAACRSDQTDELMLSADAEFMRAFLQHWQQHGEAGAQRMLDEKAGVDCRPLEPSPFSSVW